MPRGVYPRRRRAEREADLRSLRHLELKELQAEAERKTERLTDEQLLDLYSLLSRAEEETRRNAIVYYQPNPIGQEPFHYSDRRIRVLLGGNRSGKTTAGSCEAIAHALGYRPWIPEGDSRHVVRLAGGRPIPVPNVGTVLGESYKISVDRVLWPTIAEWLPPGLIGNVIKNQQAVVDTVDLKNGSRIRFMTYNQDPKEFEGFKAHWTWYDEPPKRAIFTANERSLVDYGGRSWFTMTPIRQPWVWEEIVSREGVDRRIEVFKMTIWDNAKSQGGHLDDRFIHDFLNSLPHEEREAREKGEFLHLQGRVFPAWQPKPPYWIPAFPIKNTWTRIMAIDPHSRKPIACIWAAISPETGIWYTYRELYSEKLRTVREVAEEIHERERGERIAFRVMDTSGRESERTSGTSVWEQFADHEIYCELAQKPDRDGRRHLLSARLEIDPVYECPGLVVLDSCRRLRHEFMNHVWDEWSPAVRDRHDEKQEPMKKDDDLLDGLMYLLQYGQEASDFGIWQASEEDLDELRELRPEPVLSRTGY